VVNLEQMTASVSSPWLEMQNALRSLRRTTYVLSGFLVFALVVLGLMSIRGTLEVSLVFVIGLGPFITVILADLRQFCEGVMERIRQLSEKV